MQGVAALLGFSAAEKAETCAVLRCNGTCRNAPDKTVYSGLGNCRVANLISAGSSGCPDGCLRFGDCVKVCRFDALHLDPETGIPVINPDKCTSCGACVNICPRKLFEIRPISQENQQVYVACRNRQKGAAARKNCSAACIAAKNVLKSVPTSRLKTIFLIFLTLFLPPVLAPNWPLLARPEPSSIKNK